MVALAASNKEMKKGIEYMLTWVWQPGSLYEIRANWGWYWAGCGRAFSQAKMEIGTVKKGDKIGAKSGHFQREYNPEPLVSQNENRGNHKYSKFRGV